MTCLISTYYNIIWNNAYVIDVLSRLIKLVDYAILHRSSRAIYNRKVKLNYAYMYGTVHVLKLGAYLHFLWLTDRNRQCRFIGYGIITTTFVTFTRNKLQLLTAVTQFIYLLMINISPKPCFSCIPRTYQVPDMALSSIVENWENLLVQWHHETSRLHKWVCYL